MLTVRQAAAALGMSLTFVRSEAAAGRLRGYRFGRALRFDPADVEAYRASCRSAGTRETSAGGSSSTALLTVADRSS
mgnify:CR=1 FL=1